MAMKSVLSLLLSVVMLFLVGCSSPESKLSGKWASSEIKGFVAEFKNDHTGTTFTPVPGHAGAASGQTVPTPFQWAIESDGKIKITEGATTFYGKFAGKKLELNVNGAMSVLEKVK
jgi:hypothetical protein